jgi:hypothetical protein
MEIIVNFYVFLDETTFDVIGVVCSLISDKQASLRIFFWFFV